MARTWHILVLVALVPQLVLGFSGVRLPMHLRSSSSALSTRPLRSEVHAVCQQSFAPKMMLGGSDGAIYLAEEIFAQVAAGGVGIIVFGIVGALFVGKIANIDGLEAEINQARNPSMSAPPSSYSSNSSRRDLVDDDLYNASDKLSGETELSKTELSKPK